MKAKRRKNRIKKSVIYLIASIITVIVLSVKLNASLKPVIKVQAEHFAEKEASELIDSCVSEYLDRNKYCYSDYAAVLYNDKKQITSIETISYAVNKTQSELTLAINQKLKKISGKNAEIPLGSLTKTFLLNGKGPKIHIKIAPVGCADVKLKSELLSAGINQTKHRITAVIKIKISSSTPLISFGTTSEFEFLIAESVIIGEVPDLVPYSGTLQK
ncbi:sporulation protein YunB [uncultured Ruminococcus sp.]|uniref:sporulation protein YunB n=1 Tax=uncultured Ruminococcus sp. TaxID=165186 RepID=UPI0025D3F93D|nr:sporulation protein YunB [uncultured Ruminococcus sp.]